MDQITVPKFWCVTQAVGMRDKNANMKVRNIEIEVQPEAEAANSTSSSRDVIRLERDVLLDKYLTD